MLWSTCSVGLVYKGNTAITTQDRSFGVVVVCHVRYRSLGRNDRYGNRAPKIDRRAEVKNVAVSNLPSHPMTCGLDCILTPEKIEEATEQGAGLTHINPKKSE